MSNERTTSETGTAIRRGAGLPVLAIHGHGVDHRILLAVDDALAAPGGLERIYLDLPGFGGTPALPEPGGLPELADWVTGRVRELIGERPFAVLGNSLGGLLARHVRARFPDQVRGLALLAPVVNPDSEARTLPEFRVVERDPGLDADISEEDGSAYEEYREMSAWQTPETWSRFREYVWPGVSAADDEAMERLENRYVLPEVPEEVARPYAGPTLIVTGRQDHVVGFHDQFQLATQSYPAATYAVLDGAGHNVHLDRFEESSALLRQWAARVAATAGE